MIKRFPKTRVIVGLAMVYGVSEASLHLKTKRIIEDRKQEYQRLVTSQDADSIDISKFKSATVAGMFVNPFDEYRPQTGFEYGLVRILEFFESFYGNKVELHETLPKDKEHTVEDYLHLHAHRPEMELMTTNSAVFQHCLASGNFRELGRRPSGGWFSKSFPPLNRQLLFTWLGQSCALVQISGINILTDPMLGDHLISKSIGPKRLNKAPMDFEQVQIATNNKIDFVLVSHDHPDHLEMDLVKKIGNKSTWIVPLGLKKTLARKGVYNVIEMDWWDSVKLNKFIGEGIPDDYEVVCVPAMHWSGRYILDANFTLWCSYILKQNGKAILYHAGDTGYAEELFDVIGKKHGPIALSMLPIGQYCPSWHQKPRHISPQESLRICQQTQSKYMMGIHWGTFKLSSEPILEPKNLLTRLASGLDKIDYYRAPEFGLTYVFDLDKQCEHSL